MKKALLLAIAGLFSAVAPAPALAYPPPAANVNFVSERGVPFDLVLDGRLLTRGGARQVHVDQLMPGQHWADFTLPTGYGRVVRFRSRVWLQPGLETSFVLVARPGWPLNLREVGAVPLYGPGRAGYGYNNGPGYGNGPYNSLAPYGQGGYGNAYPTPPYPNTAPPASNGPSPYGNDPNGPAGGYNPAPMDNGGYYPGSATSNYRVLPSQEIDGIMQAVKQRPFEASKLSTAKEALAQSGIQADDLKRLLRSFDFEASRVELAKFAYAHVADPQNFYRVYDAFDFDASVQEVQQAVGAVPQR